MILEWQSERQQDGEFSVRKKYQHCEIALIVTTGHACLIMAGWTHLGGGVEQTGGRERLCLPKFRNLYPHGNSMLYGCFLSGFASCRSTLPAVAVVSGHGSRGDYNRAHGLGGSVARRRHRTGEVLQVGVKGV